MKKTKTSALNSLSEMDKELSNIWIKLDSLENGQLEKRKSPDSWSVLEVLEHLNVSEGSSYKYLKYKIDQGAKFEREKLKNSIRGWMLVQFFNLPVKVKAPNVNGLDPINKELDYNTIKTQWLNTRKNLKELFENLEESNFTTTMYKHPRAGRITLAYMLKFFEIHIKRHMKQINNILNS